MKFFGWKSAGRTVASGAFAWVLDMGGREHAG
jgi:hypothetical protein